MDTETKGAIIQKNAKELGQNVVALPLAAVAVEDMVSKKAFDSEAEAVVPIRSGYYKWLEQIKEQALAVYLAYNKHAVAATVLHEQMAKLGQILR